MKNERWKSVLSVGGAALLLVGAVLQMTRWEVAPYLYLAGAVAFAYVQLTCGYEGKNFILRRLRRQQMMGAVLLVVAGVLMLTMHHNEWIACLTIAAVLELYTAFRMPAVGEDE